MHTQTAEAGFVLDEIVMWTQLQLYRLCAIGPVKYHRDVGIPKTNHHLKGLKGRKHFRMRCTPCKWCFVLSMFAVMSVIGWRKIEFIVNMCAFGPIKTPPYLRRTLLIISFTMFVIISVSFYLQCMCADTRWTHLYSLLLILSFMIFAISLPACGAFACVCTHLCSSSSLKS